MASNALLIKNTFVIIASYNVGYSFKGLSSLPPSLSPLSILLFTLFICLSLFLSHNSYPKALDMVASGRVNVKPLITHNYKLEETLDAFERARTGEGGAIKVMIHVEEGK